MAKKSRRVRRKGAQPRLSEAQLVQPTQQTTREVPPIAEATREEPEQKPKTIDFQDEYFYVVSDLKKIGVLAAAMLGGLVILSVIL